MSTVRSLADDLRQRDDDALAALLRRRPDLLHPVPSDITALTTRATTGPSVSRCLDGLDAVRLHVLHIAADLTAQTALPAADVIDAAAVPLGPGGHDQCSDAMANLREVALIWGTDEQVRVVHAVRDLLSATPTPAWPRPTLLGSGPLDPASIDEQAAFHARALIARVRDLVDEWSVHPPAVLRSGGLSLRDFAAAARTLHADWPTTSLAIELAYATRLVFDDQEETPHWVPTDQADSWLARPPSEQWLELVDAWLSLPRLPWLADEKTQVLSTDRDRRAVPVLRRQILDLLLSLPVGSGLDAANAIDVLDDQQPRRRGDLRRQTLVATLAEADAIGVIASGALSAAARIAVDQGSTSPEHRRTRNTRVQQALQAALPPDVDQVLIQADLTIVAPGPLTTEMARHLRLLADIESRGHATVYRISESSIRRTLDAGWDAATIHATLASFSRTPVPQPLSYLVDDVARRHGAVRVGNALGYIRCDDPDTLTAIVADRRLRTLALTRIAENVVISQFPTRELLSGLREAGYAPAAESPEGTVVIRRPEDRRIRAPRAQSAPAARTPEPALLDAAVRALRAGDRAGTRGPALAGPASAQAVPSLSTNAIVAKLRTALADSTPVWIGYADNDGAVTEQIVDPIRLGGGVLTAYDHRTEQVRSFTVARVTGIASIPADEG